MTKAIAALCILLVSAQISAQTAAPSFDAASIKPSKASNDSSSWNSRLGYLVMRNQTLNACIRIAYGLKVDQITGGTKGLDAELVDTSGEARGPAREPRALGSFQRPLSCTIIAEFPC